MAVDTREKRASAFGVAGPATVQLPVPDASVDDADRVQVCWVYSGISISAPGGFEPAWALKVTHTYVGGNVT